jgi:DNA-binding transcriptional LysR family regulator
MEVDRFHELNAFIAVVEAGGFTTAAHRTGDSQSAISKATRSRLPTSLV